MPLCSQFDFRYDALAQMTFEDETHFQTYAGVLAQKEVRDVMAQDEEIFADGGRTAIVVLG